MFSYSGLTADQVERLKTEFGIYAVSTGRICVAALNKSNLETITKAIVQVLRENGEVIGRGLTSLFNQ